MATTPTYISVTEGSGKKLAASTYTENSQVVLDQKVILGEPYIAHYSVAVINQDYNTSSRILSIAAGASLNVRVRYIEVFQGPSTFAASAGTVDLSIYRLTALSSGGSAITARPFDISSPAAGAAGMSSPSSITLGVLLLKGSIGTVTAVPIPGYNKWVWRESPGRNSIIIPAGTANGLIVFGENAAGGAGVKITCFVEFDETSF